MLYTSPSKSSSSHPDPPIPGGRLRANKLEFPENQVDGPNPMPGRILTRLAVSPRVFDAKC